MNSYSGDDREPMVKERGSRHQAIGIGGMGLGEGGWLRTLGCWQHTFPNLPALRCELSVEKSTVLQSELESCKELQELEPENKCETLP